MQAPPFPLLLKREKRHISGDKPLSLGVASSQIGSSYLLRE